MYPITNEVKALFESEQRKVLRITGKPLKNDNVSVGPSDIVTVNDAAAIPAKDITIDIEPVQSGSGDPSPTNVRPISGWTGANVVVSPTTDAQDGTTYPISWQAEAGTVYGGTLDVTTGLLTVTMAEVDLGTLNYSYYSGNLFTASISNLKPVLNGRLCNALCSIYVAKPGNEYASIDGSFVAGFNSTSTLAIHDSRFTDAAAFKTAMSGVQLVYELATPQTYQLSPTEVTLLLGVNNVWADTGETTLTYRPYADLIITDDNVIEDSFQIDRYSCNGEKLEVGTAIAAQMSFTLENGNRQYDGIVFEGAELFAEVGIADWTQSSPTITYMPCGYFTPDNQPRRLSTISITALDRMTLFDVVVDAADLTFPTTVAGLVGQVCTLCGVTLAQSISGLVNASVAVTELPTVQGEITYRNLIQWCAGIMGTNAWFDWSGQLRFSWYENSTGYVSTVDNRYSSDLYEDDLTVSGVEYTNNSGIVIVEGTDDYAIDLTGNAIAGPLIATVLSPLNTALNGFTYRPFTAATVNAPYLWPMDVVIFTDKDGNNHTSVLTNVAFGLNGTTAMESKGMTYAINKLAQPKGFTREQAQLVNQAMEHVEKDIDESLTQQEIFNRLTDDGAAQGLVLYNGQLYINASYINAGYLSAARIKGDILTLGGENNVNGMMQVLNASGDIAAVINNLGMEMIDGSVVSYSTDMQTRTRVANGTIAIQKDFGEMVPFGWHDLIGISTDSNGAHIQSTLGGTLFLRGGGRLNLTNKEYGGVPDEDYAEIDMNDDTITFHVVSDYTDENTFELSCNASNHPLSVGNGGTGATNQTNARTNLGFITTVVSNVTADATYTQSGSGTGIHVIRYGNVVTVNANIKLSSDFPQDWGWHTVYSGLPDIGSVGYCNGILRFDSASVAPAMVLINGTNVQVSARGASVGGLQGLLFATYICAD